MSIISRIKKVVLPMAGGPPPQTGGGAPSPMPRYAEPEPRSARGATPPAEFIEGLVKGNGLVLFMKGSPSAPMCGFSARAAAILQSYGKPITHFNVLEDEAVREAVKQYSNWPTIPQIYIGGEFMGGSDILAQMHESGELKQALDEAFPA